MPTRPFRSPRLSARWALLGAPRSSPVGLLLAAAFALAVTGCTAATTPGEDTGSGAPSDVDGPGSGDVGSDGRDDAQDTAASDVGTASDTGAGVDSGEPNPPDGCVDADRDGYGDGCPLGPDCNDANPAVGPHADEVCDDGFDNDCDGDIDEDCPCSDGQNRTCYLGDPELEGVGRCRAGVQSCDGGAWGACSHGTPRDELCDGVDDDCDGVVDEGETNACGTCGAVPVEVCGDYLDNDCNGAIDELSACTCDGRSGQPCYSGPPRTLGYGICRGGTAECVDDRVVACVDEVLPEVEVCDGVDNDCDGLVDEGLANACGVCGAETPVERCNGFDDDCDGLVDEGLLNLCGTCGTIDRDEVCGDGLDNDCDGTVDEGCRCYEGDDTCWPGDAEQRNIGACRDGTRGCDATGEFWGACTGMVLPSVEVCDGLDNDCDGIVDNGPLGCSVCGTDVEECDGLDNDCDGQIDEGLRNGCGQCVADVPPEEACGSSCCDGVDNDCDGLVDEGLLNVCGLCDEACFVTAWGADARPWSEGASRGVVVDVAERLMLGNGNTGEPYIWVANSGEATVSLVDTEQVREVGRFPTGQGPSRTAVDFDGNAFVASRAFYGQGTVTRVDLDGCAGSECARYTAPIGETNAVPRAVAIDAEGFPWVGSYNDRALRRIDPVTGVVLEEYDTGMNIFGMSISADGVIWLTSIDIPEYEGGRIGAFDIDERAMVGTWQVPGCSNPYAITIDADGDVWFSNFTCDELVRYRPDSGAFDTFSLPEFDRMRGVAVDADGMVWVLSYGSDHAARFDPVTETFVGLYDVCDAPIGLGIANDRHVWVVCYGSDNAVRLTYDGAIVGEVALGRAPYSFGDISGFQLRNLMSRRGAWTVAFDCGREGCRYDELHLAGDFPGETAVVSRARVSPDGEVWSPWTAHFVGSPANLSGLPGGRYVEVEVELRTSRRGLSPLVERVELTWWHD